MFTGPAEFESCPRLPKPPTCAHLEVQRYSEISLLAPERSTLSFRAGELEHQLALTRQHIHRLVLPRSRRPRPQRCQPPSPRGCQENLVISPPRCYDTVLEITSPPPSIGQAFSCQVPVPSFSGFEKVNPSGDRPRYMSRAPASQFRHITRISPANRSRPMDAAFADRSLR